MLEIGDREVAVDALHAASALPVGLSGSAKSEMSGSVVPPSITSKERSLRRGWQRAGRLGRLLEALARPKHAAEPQDQEERDAGEDDDLDHLRAHRPTFSFFRPRRWRPDGSFPM